MSLQEIRRYQVYRVDRPRHSKMRAILRLLRRLHATPKH